MKEIKIGLLGFGTVGKGLYDLLNNNDTLISKRTDVDLKIKTICDMRLDYIKENSENVKATDNWKDLITDSEIDIVVELIGGINPAKEVICEALKNGKSVVTANKKLLAESGAEIFKLAQNTKSKLGFEAAIGGGIPCVDALKNGLVSNNIDYVMGILNGTTNYILTRMEEDNLPFEDALKEAQEKGFAEADPTFDIEGYDAGHKIQLLGMLSFNQDINYSDLTIEGITKISPMDIKFARSMGYAIKLLGICKKVDDQVDIRVHPTMIKDDVILASVSHEFNAVLYNGDMTGEVALYGKGAGALPTASAVASDIVRIAMKEDIIESAIPVSGGEASILPVDKRSSRYYFRMETSDRAGILEKISGTFAKNNISLSTVMQKDGDGSSVALIIVTHKSVESDVLASLEEINGFDFVKKEVVMIRIEDELE